MTAVRDLLNSEQVVKYDELMNALGEPSPGRTDFTKWSRENLERFARQAADENLILRDTVKRLNEDLSVVREAWRQCQRESVK